VTPNRSAIRLQAGSHQSDALGKHAAIEQPTNPACAFLNLTVGPARAKAIETSAWRGRTRELDIDGASEARRYLKRITTLERCIPAWPHTRRKVDKDGPSGGIQSGAEQGDRDPGGIGKAEDQEPPAWQRQARSFDLLGGPIENRAGQVEPGRVGGRPGGLGDRQDIETASAGVGAAQRAKPDGPRRIQPAAVEKVTDRADRCPETFGELSEDRTQTRGGPGRTLDQDSLESTRRKDRLPRGLEDLAREPVKSLDA
jgi:hypothetical protein